MKPFRFGPVKGQLFYFAAVSLLGLLTTAVNQFIYGALFLLGMFLLKKLKKLPASNLVIMTGCYLLFFAAGSYDSVHFATQYSGSEKSFVIFFDDEIQVDGDLLFAYAKAMPSDEKLAVKYRIKSSVEQQSIQELLIPGMLCKASGSLDSPSTARNPNAFDYKQYLQRNKISWILDVDTLSLETCTKQTGIITTLKAFRNREIALIKNTFPEETSALAAALIFGERYLFNAETERSYQKIGIVHLLAISGLHVGLLTGMLYYLFIRMGVTREKTEVLLIIFLPIYAVMTGLAPPVVRAAAMLMMLIGSRRLALRMTPLDAVSATFIIMALFKPNIIFDTGFQLSFAVSFSLVISAPVILKAFPTFLKQAAAASFIAQLSSLPVILATFYELSVISIFANILFVPLFSFVLLPLLLISYIILLVLGALPSFYLYFLESLVHFSNTSAMILSELPVSTIIIGKPEPVFLLLLIIVIPTFFYKWEAFILKKSKPPLWLFAIPLLPLMMQVGLAYIDPYGQVVFLDVGQGDSIFIKMPYNQGNYLIDTGGVLPFDKENWQQRGNSFDPGEKIVVPFLKSEGIRTIDKMILTHGDADHIGGAIALMEEIRVKQLIIPRVSERSDLEQNIIKIAREKGTEIYLAEMGTGWKTEQGDFFIINPSESTGERNDQSIVLHAAIGGEDWLFTGDLGMEGEKVLDQKIKDMDIDVLKVGHHGSKYSSSDLLLERTTPDFAIISVGEKNRYGHPGKDVIARLKERDIRIFRTDENGAVIYKFKGDSGTFTTKIP